MSEIRNADFDASVSVDHHAKILLHERLLLLLYRYRHAVQLRCTFAKTFFQIICTNSWTDQKKKQKLNTVITTLYPS